MEAINVNYCLGGCTSFLFDWERGTITRATFSILVVLGLRSSIVSLGTKATTDPAFTNAKSTTTPHNDNATRRGRSIYILPTGIATFVSASFGFRVHRCRRPSEG